MVDIILKQTEMKRLELELKSFKNSNEDLLFIHNYTNSYRVGSIDEFKPQVKIFDDMELVLYEKNIKKFTIDNMRYIHFTINGDNIVGTDGMANSRIGMALGFIVFGFTYIMTETKFKKFKKYLYKNITIKKINRTP